MSQGKDSTNGSTNIEKNNDVKHLPQTIVSIGEYPIKTILKQTSASKQSLSIFMEKSSSDIYKWLPKDSTNRFVIGFEGSKADTHFWYNLQPTITKNESIVENAKKHSIETAVIFASIWDGVGSASLPTLISKFKASGIETLSIAILPSKIQPADAHFNAYAAVQLSAATDGAAVLLIDRDCLEGYEGVDRNGSIIKGNLVSNYLLELLGSKDLLVEEISELSRSFNVKLFAPLLVTGASLNIYGSLENMLNAALLKPLLTFDLPSASLLYGLIRMPSHLADKLTRTKIELTVTNWLREKTNLQSIHITEPVYTSEINDRIDVLLFIGGFEIRRLFADTENKVMPLKQRAVERGLITDNWQAIVKNEEDMSRIEPTIKNMEQQTGEEQNAPQKEALTELKKVSKRQRKPRSKKAK